MHFDLFHSNLSQALRLEPSELPASEQNLQHALSPRIESEGKKDSVFVRANLVLRTLGADRAYQFTALLLNQHSIFVNCHDFSKYPFVPATTILQGYLEVKAPGGLQPALVPFLGKIDKIFASEDSNDTTPAGFILKIIQIDFNDRTLLESIVLSATQIA